MAAEKRPTASHRGPDVAGGEHLSIEEKYDEVRQLINIGKEKGYLLYDEVSDLLPPEISSSAEDLDDLFSAFGTAGIEVIDTDDQSFAALDKVTSEKKFEEQPESDVELDLTPGALEKTNDPVRMYLREMGTVPLLTRDGEVEIAKRIGSLKWETGQPLRSAEDVYHHFRDNLGAEKRELFYVVLLNNKNRKIETKS